MGYNTTLMILNDQFGSIQKDPQRFVDEINQMMNYGGDIFGQTTVMKTEHADVSKLYFTHGNWISDLTPYFIEWETEKSTNPKMAEYLLERVVQAKRMLKDSEKQLKKILENQRAEEDTESA